MDPHHRLQLAHRIHLGLLCQLGQGIDVKQLLVNALYARDVLLVCQAYPGTELQRLGPQFREATAERTSPAAPLGPAAGWVTAAASAFPSRLRPAATPVSTASPIRCPTRASRRDAG